MECLKFDLGGKTAFFKKPEINDVNFTFSNIHKIATLGMIGAIIGLNGRQQSKENGKIKFYETLKSIELSIVPFSPYFSKTYTIFNNATGFANKSASKHGATQNIKQQWLTNPKWTIYLKQGALDNTIWGKIKKYFLQGNYVYEPYLGGRPHIANITNVNLIDIDNIKNKEDIYKVDSLVKYNEIIDIDSQVYENCEDEYSYCLKEYTPIKLDDRGLYITEKMLHTNYEIYEVKNTNNFYKYNNNILYFI
ncbi:TPA: type I-B CRISPR-associated protein Cas5b [Clostridium botulinum]|uniref:type I-B CRISPR-associated protein Cas5b n=1 Tax=Clostridium botulinum TaxID=1491 RepID=UPI000464FC16|nr:type I-B CRISPR-associated protein Cas5b [Clostridium botulinum]APR02527.1 CRISPR-associated Cas5 domain protein [Clostridium botulinum]AUN01444.1 type I-B CRISPR-associated protein Cas5 [Clostridium botulinum]MBN3359171.1 type I-B CRISPR-associated protein Cas5 [Clostridium botulinum]MBN3367246.1 type I-B CRISPR-associated protein Cas5 [Clostridium botulinum]MBN3371630.1 type I-B CRISPR-associated protein Cas5 [Clostridium botulinum]